MKPIIEKPFPEGASEEVVCEAIDNVGEKDLWARFGHMLPMEQRGNIFVLEAGPERKADLARVAGREYVYGHHLYQATCRGKLTLVYIRDMAEAAEYQGKPFGREHLSAEWERKLGVKTRESFHQEADTRTFSQYCRAEAELCEQLLLRSPGGSGLCAHGASECELAGRSVVRVAEQCAHLPVSELSCLEFELQGKGRVDCRARVLALLCPDVMPQ